MKAQDTATPSITVGQAGIYQIVIQGRLSQTLRHRFDEMSIAAETSPDNVPLTVLTGEVADQAALYGLIGRLRDVGLPLISLELKRVIDRGG